MTQPARDIRRFYRKWMRPAGLSLFGVREKESDLYIGAGSDLSDHALRVLRQVRASLEKYIAGDPDFVTTLEPYEAAANAPAVARMMSAAAERAGVGPMAAVAGAVAEEVGRALLTLSEEVIVENGGDIFIAGKTPRVVGVYSGEGEFHDKVGIELPPRPKGCGVATSSAVIGPSLSLGKADAATVIAENAALADACATALANRIHTRKDLKPAVKWCLSVPGIEGALAVLGNTLAVEGSGFQIVSL